jgi:hypothetical protein
MHTVGILVLWFFFGLALAVEGASLSSDPNTLDYREAGRVKWMYYDILNAVGMFVVVVSGLKIAIKIAPVVVALVLAIINGVWNLLLGFLAL